MKIGGGVLPTDSPNADASLDFLFLALLAFVKPRGGTIFYAPLRLDSPGKFREEPDLCYSSL